MHSRLIGAACALAVSSTPVVVEARSALQDSTDLKIRNSSSVDALGSENTVYIHPTDSRILLVSMNNPTSPGISAWVSQDGGKTWSGDNSAAGGPGNGDPAAVIRRAVGSTPVRYVVGQITNKEAGANLGLAQEVVYKDTATSLSWTRVTLVDNTQGQTDKNHLWVDNHPSSGQIGYLYAGWSNVNKRAEAMVSVDGGLSWIRRRSIDGDDNRAEWAVNLQVAIDATYRDDIYAVWAETNQVPKSQAKKLYFNKSTNAGLNWGLQPTEVSRLHTA